MCWPRVTLLTLLAAQPAGRSGALDPQNPSADGAQAVARVLADHGVQVSVVRRAAELDRATVDSDTTVVVTSTENLGRSTAQRLRRRARSAGGLVLAAPGASVVDALALPVVADDVLAADRIRASCADPLLSGLVLEVPRSSGFRGRSGSVTGCFSGRGRHPASGVVRVDGRVATYLVGAAALFTNQRVDRADNAATALRLLGQHTRLVWYVPDLRDITVGDSGSLAAQLPGGLVPTLWLLAAAVVATMVWRGRRLGPLVVEPLPVSVKAVESTQGRGRLYRRVRDRPHAAALLREAAADRLTARLRLPVGTDAARLTAAVADLTGADPREVYDVLVARTVGDDRALTRLAADLTALEKEVHHS